MSRVPNQGSKWIREDLRLAIYLRDGGCCVYCGCNDTLTLDHVTPSLREGSNDPRNLVTACKSCNSKKQDQTLCQWLGSSLAAEMKKRVRKHTARAITRYRLEARRLIEECGESGCVEQKLVTNNGKETATAGPLGCLSGRDEEDTYEQPERSDLDDLRAADNEDRGRGYRNGNW